MNLIEGIQQKCNFIREKIIPVYDEIGPAGVFGKMGLQADIKKGEQSIAGGDTIEMLRVYKELESTCETAL
jgi:hypothetical protein